MDIKKIIHELSLKRSTFHSEKDFQLALAWQIKEHSDLEVNLERRFNFENGSHAYVDISFSVDDMLFPFELKHKTIKHGAKDGGRYLFIRDIERLERIVELENCGLGFAIFLTNDSGYWIKGDKETIDKDFLLYEGRILEGVMKWKDKSFALDMKEYKEPILLKGKYEVHWRDYSQDFKYLLIEVEEN